MQPISSIMQGPINDNEEYKYSFNDNDSMNIDKTADWLVDKLKSPESRPFYCKVAMRLKRGQIDRLVTTAIEKGNSPSRLFNYLACREMNSHLEKPKKT